MSTPCEDRGYEVGQVFEIINTGNGGEIGDVLILEHVSFDSAPRFLHINGEKKGEANFYNIKDGLGVCRVKRIYPPEESKDITMVCKETGKETILSRESAKTQNFV